MGCKEVDFTINERRYKIMQWPPTYALKIKGQVVKHVGSIGNLKKPSFEKIDPEKLIYLMNILTKDVMSYDLKKKIDFDEYFSEYPEDLYPIIIEVLNIQFARFFGGNGFAMFQKIAESMNQKVA